MAETRTIARPTAWIDTLYRRTIPLAVIAFTAAVVTDWTYSNSANLMWSNFSAWLLLVGLVGCGAALMMLALGVRGSEGGGSDGGWLPVFVLLAAFVVEIVNFMIHMRDGWTAVVPTGLLLSIIGAITAIAAAWLSRTPAIEVRA